MGLKKLTGILLTGALALGLCALPASAVEEPDGGAPLAAPVFADTADHAARAAIESFAALDVLRGYEDGSFRPDGTIARAELCAILDRTFGYTAKAANTFTDVDEGAWYAGPVLRLNAAGVAQGDGNGKIRPLALVTWQEALVMISRAFRLAECTGVALHYADAGEIAPWALGHVSALYEGGYLTEASHLDPSAPFTRADAVIVLDNIISDLGWEAAGRMVVNGTLIPYGDYHFYPGDFVEVDGRVYYTGDEAVPSYGIDVSSYQDEIDWRAVAADGVEFAMIRLGYRGYTVGNIMKDEYFEANVQGALAAGLEVGVYFFSQAITVEEALEEAAYVLEKIAPYGDAITLPVVFDWEDIGVTHARTYKLPTEILNACALAFCGAVEEAGYQPMIYFYQYLGEKRYDLDTIDGYPFWYCWYNTYWPNLERPFHMWQYTSSGYVDGIEGKVDWNIRFLPAPVAA